MIFPQPKPASRLEDREAERRLTYVTDRAFRKDVWDRDHGCCRWCGCRVTKTIEHVADRGEVHHLHGKLGVFALRKSLRDLNLRGMP